MTMKKDNAKHAKLPGLTSSIVIMAVAFAFAGCAQPNARTGGRGGHGGNYTGATGSIDYATLSAELTDAERQEDAAKYYHETPAEIDPDFLAEVTTELSADQMFYPTQMDDLYDPDFSFSNGYGVLENGVTYSASETVMIGVTEEVFEQYYDWANSYDDQTLIYKIWYPGYHYAQARTASGLEVVEDIGQGKESIIMLGAAGGNRKVNDSRIVETYFVNSTNTMLDGDGQIPGVLFHLKYLNDDGYVVDRCVAWFGCNVGNGELSVNTDFIDDASGRARGMAIHSAGENTNLAAVMREFSRDRN